MRKLLRRMAKDEMTRRGYSEVNLRMKYGNWRNVLGKWAYPGFSGHKRQHKNSRQPILKYPAGR